MIAMYIALAWLATFFVVICVADSRRQNRKNGRTPAKYLKANPRMLEKI